MQFTLYYILIKYIYPMHGGGDQNRDNDENGKLLSERLI